MGFLKRWKAAKEAKLKEREEKRRAKEEAKRLKAVRRKKRVRNAKIVAALVAAGGLGVAYKIITQPVQYRQPTEIVKPVFGPAPRPNCLDYRIIGKPSLSAKTIDWIIPRNSPLAKKENFILRQSIEFGIDPAIALAQFKIEGNFGLQGAAAKNKNPGNIRGRPRFEKRNGKTIRIDTFRKFGSWEQGIRAYFDLIANGSYYYCNQKFDAEAIIPTYAPSADKNDPNAYIAEMRRLVKEWRELEERLNAQQKP